MMSEKGKRKEATYHFTLPDPRLGIGNLEPLVELGEKEEKRNYKRENIKA